MPTALYDIIPQSGYTGSVVLLRVATEAAGQLMGIFSAQTLEALLWTRVASENGISMPSLLSISPSTGYGGLWELWGWPIDEKSPTRQKPALTKGRRVLRDWIVGPLIKIVGVLFYPIKDIVISLKGRSKRVQTLISTTHHQSIRLDAAYHSYHHLWILFRYPHS